MAIEVREKVGESGQKITHVTVYNESIGVAPALVYLLIGAAAIYLVVMLVQVCRSRHRRRNGAGSQTSTEEDFEFFSDTETYDDFETSASESYTSGSRGQAKDTMSNTSIETPQQLKGRTFSESKPLQPQ